MQTLSNQEVDAVSGGTDPTYIPGPITWAFPFDPPWTQPPPSPEAVLLRRAIERAQLVAIGVAHIG